MEVEIKTKDDVLAIAKKQNVEFIRLQFVDILGAPKNIVIPTERLEEAMDEGMPFDASSIAGYATIEESDKIARPDPKSFVILPESIDPRVLPPKPWILNGAKGRPSRIIKSLLLDPSVEEALNWKLVRKHEMIGREISDAETDLMDDAHLAVVAYGTAARIAKGAIKRVREAGLKVGLFRPVTLWPFPEKTLQGLDESEENFLVFEMSTGQMLEDVKLSLAGSGEVHFYGRPGGPIPTPDELAKVISRLYHRQKL